MAGPLFKKRAARRHPSSGGVETFMAMAVGMDCIPKTGGGFWRRCKTGGGEVKDPNGERRKTEGNHGTKCFPYYFCPHSIGTRRKWLIWDPRRPQTDAFAPGLTRGERTGSRIFQWVWPYVLVRAFALCSYSLNYALNIQEISAARSDCFLDHWIA